MNRGSTRALARDHAPGGQGFDGIDVAHGLEACVQRPIPLLRCTVTHTLRMCTSCLSPKRLCAKRYHTISTLASHPSAATLVIEIP